MLEKISIDVSGNDADQKCKICGAHATGFHFNAQSCGACAAFFRRAVVLSRAYRCMTGKKDCSIFYKNRSLCKACRYDICLKEGMSTTLVQIPKENEPKQRSYYTKSGLKRNKRFSTVKLPIDTPPSSTEKESNEMESLQSMESPIKMETDEKPTDNLPSPSIEKPTCKRTVGTVADDLQDILSNLILEEMKIAERRRIMFCERPVASLLGLDSHCPFGLDDIKPLKFRNFRKSIRIHILLIHEWIRSWDEVYKELDMSDRITFLRKCVLYHTILDPCYISLQLGDESKFVMQNGGFVSLDPDSENGGWEDEKEISTENKKKIYLPLLNRLKSDILDPMTNLKISFEEFVALKAFVSIQMTIPDLSENGKEILKRQLDRLSCSLFNNYLSNLNESEKSERFGSIIMLLTPIFETANIFVESHHQVQFFNLWELDSLMLQFLKNKV